MLEYKGFNDYRVEVYKDDSILGTFGYISNLWFLSLWLNIHFLYHNWTSIKVYHRLSDTFIQQYSREGAIPAKPKI